MYMLHIFLMLYTIYTMCIQARFGAAEVGVPCAGRKVMADITLTTYNPIHTGYCSTINITYILTVFISIYIHVWHDRYILNGDREELRNIKHELASLRIASLSPPGTTTTTDPYTPTTTTTTDPSRSATNAWRNTGDTIYPTAATAIASSGSALGTSASATRATPTFLSDDDRLKQKLTSDLPSTTAASSYPYSHTATPPLGYTHPPDERLHSTDPATDTAASLDQSYLSASDSEVQEIIRSLPPPAPTRPSLVSDIDTLTAHHSPGDEAYLACLQGKTSYTH